MRGPLARRAVRVGSAALVVIAATAHVAQAAKFDTRIFAPVPAPGYPGNVVVGADGTVFTSSDDNSDNSPSKVFAYTPSGQLLNEWTVRGQNTSGGPGSFGINVMTRDAAGRLFLADQNPARIVVLDPRTGQQTTYATIPDVPTCSTAPSGAPCKDTLTDNAPFPNYGTFDSTGNLYISDDQQGIIWRIPPGGKPQIWITDPRLAGGLSPGIPTGPTAVAWAPGYRTLYLATLLNSPDTPGSIYTVEVGADGRPGPLTLLYQGDALHYAIDAVTVSRAGNLYVDNQSLPGGSLFELSPQGNLVGGTPFPDLSPIPWQVPSGGAFVGDDLLLGNLAYFTGPADPGLWNLFDVSIGEPGLPIPHPCLTSDGCNKQTTSTAGQHHARRGHIHRRRHTRHRHRHHKHQRPRHHSQSR